MENYDSWSRGCSYQCEICFSNYYDLLDFRSHIKNDHKIKPKTYFKGTVRYVIKRTIECALCSSEVVHDRDPIQ